MTRINVLSLSSGYNLRLAAPFEPPQAVIARVDEIWAEEKQKRNDTLTNGRIYSLFDYRSDYLALQPSEYRYALARRRAPDLVDAGLNIRPVAVTGVLVCADGLVLGRRGDQVASDAGLWEPAPAGGLDRPDPAAQVLDELREELGIDPSCIAFPEVRGLVEDIESGVLDIVFRLYTAVSAEDIEAAFGAFGTNEYGEVKVVAQADLAAFLEANHDRLLPALRPMLRLAGLL